MLQACARPGRLARPPRPRGGPLAPECRLPACNRHSSISQERESDDGAMFRGQVDKYTWVDLGSSYLPSDLLARVRTVLSHVLYAAAVDGAPRFVDLPIER